MWGSAPLREKKNEPSEKYVNYSLVGSLFFVLVSSSLAEFHMHEPESAIAVDL